MSQSDLSKVYDLRWELSNPQYYPDDSAPPVPNMSMGVVEETSLPFNNTQDIVSLSDSQVTSDGVLDLYNFTGVTNTSDFDYKSGQTNATADHVFYSHLNVETKLPPYFVTNYTNSLESYFRDFIPAMCGLYNVEIPTGGIHLGYYANPSYGYQDRFGVSSSGEAMHTVHDVLNRSSINRSNDPVRDVDILDFVFHLVGAGTTDISSRTTDMTIFSDQFNIRIRYTGRRSSSKYNQTFRVFFQDNLSATPEEVEVITNFTSYNIDLDSPQLVRVDLANKTIEVIANQVNNQWESVNNSFSHTNTRPKFRVTEINGGFNSQTNFSMQIIGYRDFDVLPLVEQYENVLFYKKYYFPLVDAGRIQSDLIYRVFPKYSGNAWEYINKLSALYPFRRLI